MRCPGPGRHMHWRECLLPTQCPALGDYRPLGAVSLPRAAQLPLYLCAVRVLAVCHAVLYKQLSAWMLHGLLLDQYEEFFIKQGPSSGMVPAQPEEEEDDLGIGGLTGKQLRELQDMVRFGNWESA